VTDRVSTDGSKARYAPPLHDARRRRGDWTRRRCPSVRAALDLAHLEPSVNPRSPTTHDASLQTRPQACGRVRGQAIEWRCWRRVLFGRSNGAPKRGWPARGLAALRALPIGAALWTCRATSGRAEALREQRLRQRSALRD